MTMQQAENRAQTVKLHLQKWNAETQQLEPGELVWEEECQADPATGVLHLREPRVIEPGQYFLVFPFEGELGAEPLNAKTATEIERLDVKIVK